MATKRVSPSFITLSTQEDNTKQKLLNALTSQSNALDSVDPTDIKQSISTIKTLKAEYTIASQQQNNYRIGILRMLRSTLLVK